MPARRRYSRDEVQQRRPARPSARPDVAGGHLRLLDVHVRVEGDPEQVVGRVAADHGVAADPPVVRQPDLVHRPAADLQRRTRSVTSTRASIAVRAVTIVAQPQLLQPALAGQLGETSQKNSGCSSDR